MQVAVDISLYPLQNDYIPPIKDVIARLNQYATLEVVTNPMSTQIRGLSEIGTTFERVPKAVFAIRILNNPIAGD